MEGLWVWCVEIGNLEMGIGDWGFGVGRRVVEVGLFVVGLVVSDRGMALVSGREMKERRDGEVRGA